MLPVFVFPVNKRLSKSRSDIKWDRQSPGTPQFTSICYVHIVHIVLLWFMFIKCEFKQATFNSCGKFENNRSGNRKKFCVFCSNKVGDKMSLKIHKSALLYAEL